MNSIWLVTCGEYSDYHVVAAFSTEEKAKAYAAWKNGPDDDGDCEVEQFVLDEPVPNNRGGFAARLHVGGPWGTSSTPYIVWEPDGPQYEKASVTRRSSPDEPREFIYTYRAIGKTKEHARRSIEELRRAVEAGTYVFPPPEAPHD